MSGRLIIPDLLSWVGEAARAACPPAPPLVVTIPVRDEARRIGGCLDALAAQVDLSGRALPSDAFGVLLLLNNCRDGTADEIRRNTPRLPFALRVVARELPPSHAHAGAARRLAMDAAAGWLKAGDGRGAILTTDADTRVAPDWIARHQALFARSLDGVAGYVVGDEEESGSLPPDVRRRGRLESRYGRMLTELRARIDPEPHDPWPCHAMAAGASLAVTLAAYEAIGGLPLRRVGEDRALVAELLRRDARIRHCPEIRVTTSCRLIGRAAGGMADTLRQRVADPNAPCDETLEPVLDALHRNYWRAALRDRYETGRWGDRAWTAALGIAEDTATELDALPHFGAFWAAVERLGPSLRRRRLHPVDLPVEILRARGVLGWLRAQGDPPARLAAAG
ncbi:MAG TPA: glycosyltransferase [Aliidongia sp.]|uniref:glycosyltransferase n=1 Tax=Aliidongia sp. TaxID=1914230 RepID=UPI002DDD58D2|nr:glycosyltransferase [Aliidongia sp.]HEV2673320.1 glycosyltransferase [Aliidongia sp.]